MPGLIQIETSRLLLRQWKPADRAPFAAMNADPKVMRHFPALLGRAESDAMADRCQVLIEERGWGFWAAELKAGGTFIGFVGLHTPSPSLPFSPCVEIGWRLAADYWGQGLASEAAWAVFETGFGTLDLSEILSFTAIENRRSRALMERLGMRETEEFEHPGVPVGHPLRRHCLYRLDRERFAAQSAATE